MSDRMVNQFMEMVRIDSESGNEAEMMDYLLEEIKKIGGEAKLDGYGNLVAKFEAKGCDGKEPILLSCHADTVKPGIGIEPAARPDPMPRATTGRFDSVASWITLLTCSVVWGKTITPGLLSTKVPSKL